MISSVGNYVSFRNEGAWTGALAGVLVAANLASSILDRPAAPERQTKYKTWAYLVLLTAGAASGGYIGRMADRQDAAIIHFLAKIIWNRHVR